MKKFLYQELSYLYRIAFFIICCLVLFPYTIYNQPADGLDASWMISINMAIQKGLIWGKDYLFTYGPLGYLSTGVAVFVPKYHILLFSSFIYLNICAILFLIIQKFASFKRIGFIASLILLFTLSNVAHLELSSTMLLTCTFWLAYSIKEQKIWAGIIAVFTSVLMFFIKLDTGIVINAFLILFYLYQFVLGKNKLGYAFLFLVNYVGIWFLCPLLRVDLEHYFFANLHVISSYNDAMFTPNNVIVIFIGLLSIAFVLGYLIQNLSSVLKNAASILITLFSLMMLFILFKHGFVRHMGYMFIHPPLMLVVMLMLGYFLEIRKIQFIHLLFLLLLPTTLIKSSIMAIEDIDYKTPKLYALKLNTINFAFKHILHKTYVPPLSKLSENNQLKVPYQIPTRITNTIGNATVDIVPLLVCYLYFNHLNYVPRPGIQTYSNYDGFLDSMAASKYYSSTRPEYLIYCAKEFGWDAAIDNRYPFFDEPKTKIAMLQHYAVTDSFDNQLLLKRLSIPKKISYGNKEKLSASFNQAIPIEKSNDLISMKFNIQYNLLGKLIRFLYQPPYLSATFTLDNGKKVEYRVIKPILKEGVLINKFIITNTDAAKLFNGDLSHIPSITSIKINAATWGLNPTIELEKQSFSVH